MAEPVHVTVDPAAYVPLTWVRKTVAGGVNRPKTLFKKKGSQEGLENGIVSEIQGELQERFHGTFTLIAFGKKTLLTEFNPYTHLVLKL